MYSNKQNVNILTALLVEHGIRHAVVCPGSRNAPIVHNLNECPQIACYPVTDERSAGFYALGMAQALAEPVAVCVTSGTALLNLAPAVAEAWYQHQPIVVVSADRPQQWIDQLDGQTLPQADALGRFVRQAVSLPEVHSDEEHWHCNRLVNEALLEMGEAGHGPVHINVPISEPLFDFAVPELPRERAICRVRPTADYDCLPPVFVDDFLQAKRPMVVFGQTSPHDLSGQEGEYLFGHTIVLHEALAPFPSVSHFDEVLSQLTSEEKEALQPDVVLYIGGCIVSKRLRQFLRQARKARVWRISPSGRVEDTFQNLRGVVVGDAESVVASLSHKMKHKFNTKAMDYRRQWLQLLKKADAHAERYAPPYSQMAAVRLFEEQLALYKEATHSVPAVHYANSTAIRLANIYARHHVWCNRGVNGIEGSLSTAAGFSVVAHLSPLPARHTPLTFCVIGDLSFFYDQNALWNQSLNGNLRIILLNNGKGGIFNLLAGLEQSPARDRLVAARHHTTAEGTCLQNDIYYQQATNQEELSQGIELLIKSDLGRPILLEVMTSADDDERAYREYLNSK